MIFFFPGLVAGALMTPKKNKKKNSEHGSGERDKGQIKNHKELSG
jgi:hypothetical protein